MALSAVMPAALSAAGVLSSSALTAIPAAYYGLKVFSRSASYLHLTAPKPAREDDACSVNSRPKSDSAFDWTFAPLARELSRQAGGFEGERRWPLGNQSTTLLGLTLSQAASQPSSCFVRHHSIIPQSRQQQPVIPASVAAQAQHTAAVPLQLPTAEELQQPGVLSRWFGRVTPRMKGFSRKLALRQVNRKIIARVARRFTIGIPVLGFYFVSKLMVKDLARVRAEASAGEYRVAGLFATALAADILDLAAQFTVIAGLSHNNLGVGLASAAALLVAADKASLATAALSFSCGLGGELLALQHAADRDEAAATSE